jgi:predicted peroxiredoxin
MGDTTRPDPITKVSIIISKGSLEGIYPGLIMANGARAEGIEANLFFTFFGLDAIHKARHEHIKLATVGNPGLHLATMAGGLPGVSTIMTRYMNHKMEELDLQGLGRPVRPRPGRLHRAGRVDHHRGGVLRDRRRRPDHLHLRAPPSDRARWDTRRRAAGSTAPDLR